MASIQKSLDAINNFVWGPPLLILLTVVGVYLTIRLRGIQFRYFWYAHKLAFSKDDGKSEGDISHFQALMTALAATIGIGSITGVATAIATGGIGSIFWMWVAAGLGMATKYAEGVLAIKYRIVDGRKQMCGGPMYYIEKGMKQKWLGVVFAVFGILTAIGTGNMVQSNSVALACKELFHLDPLYTGLFLVIIIGISLLGGIKSIGKMASVLIPAMAIFYIIGGLFIISLRIEHVPHAIAMIVKTAFTGQAAAGGFLGATVMQAIQMGVSRGVFSSEAGLGSSPIAAAAAKTDTPSRQALVSMCSVFITTGVVCTITALTIVLTGVLGQTDASGKILDGSSLVLRAFNTVIPGGGIIVTIALIPFAFSTTIGWAYYGEKCLEYLFGLKSTIYYRILYILLVLPGAMLSLDMVWSIANILNGLMAFPNLIGLLCLGGIVSAETKVFEKILRKERKDKKAPAIVTTD
jgi:alanine or glycine:cation symporter, AGCS family